MLGDRVSIHRFYDGFLFASSQPEGPEYDISLIPTPTQGFHRYAQYHPQQIIPYFQAMFVAIV